MAQELTQNQQAVYDLWNQGLSNLQIISQTNLSEGYVYILTKKWENRPSYRFPKDKESEVCEKYQAGISASEIGRELGFTHHTITRVLKRHGIEPFAFRRQHFSAKQRKEMLKLWQDGVAQHKIREQFKTSEWIIKEVLREEGSDLIREAKLGPRNPVWKGGRHQTVQGYILIWADPNHPFHKEMANQKGPDGTKNGTFLEHRIVMAEHLGRPLLSSEQVHHINGDRADNHIENLQLRKSKNHGAGQDWCCTDCGSVNIVARKL